MRKPKPQEEKESEDDDAIHNHFALCDIWEEDDKETDPGKEYGGDLGNLNAFNFFSPNEDEMKSVSFSNLSKFKGNLTGRLLILLDTGATDHIICNSALKSDIGPALEKKTVITNAGKMVVDRKGVFPGVGEVYFHPTAVINVLSLGMLENQPEVFDVKK